MPAAIMGEIFPWEMPEAISEDLTVVLRDWNFVNETPLVARLPAYPSDSDTYLMRSTTDRPTTVQLNGAALIGATAIILDDVTYLQNGDILEFKFANSTVELIEVVADPNETTSTITVKRAVSGTTASALADDTVLRIVGNSRTGGEIMQKAISMANVTATNYIQTHQFPVEVAGLTQDLGNFRAGLIYPGASTPLDGFRMAAMNNCAMSIETSLLFGRGESATSTTTKRAKTKGFRQLCGDAGRWLYQPTNYASYGIADFIRDTVAGPAVYGGSPNLYVMSPDWIGGLAKWKITLSQMDMGTTSLDINIRSFNSPTVNGATFVVHPKMPAGTLFACNTADAYIRYVPVTGVPGGGIVKFKPRGSLGDAWQGDVLARVGAGLDHANRAVWLEGLTGFAAS